MSYKLIQELLNDLENSVDEDYAREKAEEAGVSVDRRMRILEVDEREKAVEVLRLQDFYIDLQRSILDNVGSFFGYTHAVARARGSPLRIDADGDVTDFYGKGDLATEMLIQELEQEFGSKVIDRRLRNTLMDSTSDRMAGLLPERVRETESSTEGFWETLFG